MTPVGKGLEGGTLRRKPYVRVYLQIPPRTTGLPAFPWNYQGRKKRVEKNFIKLEAGSYKPGYFRWVP